MLLKDENKDAIVIFSGRVARELLRRGYTVIDVKPDRTNKIRTVFVFRYEGNFDKDLSDIAYDENGDMF